MNWESRFLNYSNQLSREYTEIEKVPQSKLDVLRNLKSKEEDDKLWITLGGPIQTMITGLIGFLVLYLRKETWTKSSFGIINWIAVFMGLFWSRQIFNLLIGIFNYLFGHASTPFGGDEAKISNILNMPSGTIGIVTGIIGMVVCSIIVFKVVPKHDRLIFLLLGIFGSAIGYMIWFEIIGPKILP